MATKEIYLRDTAGEPLKVRYEDNAGDGIFRPQSVLVNAAGQPIFSAARAAGDALSNPTAPEVLAHAHEWDGQQWQRRRNNARETIFAGAVRNSTQTSGVLTNHNHDGGEFILRVTQNPGGAETLTLRILSYDVLNSVYCVHFAQMAIPAATNSIYTLKVHPGSSGAPENATNNKTYALFLPRSYAVEVVHSGGGGWNYSLTVNYG